MNINITIPIEIRPEPAFWSGVQWCSLIVNGHHICRFDNVEQATSAAGNLKLALEKTYTSND
jgi:hypothetical protein